MQEYIIDEVMAFIEDRLEGLDDEIKEDIIYVIEDRLSEMRDNLSTD